MCQEALKNIPFLSIMVLMRTDYPWDIYLTDFTWFTESLSNLNSLSVYKTRNSAIKRKAELRLRHLEQVLKIT